jgi:hypothetical protein
MKMSATALFSVVLLVASVSALAVQTTNVKVTNFPLDEQGNLKIKVAEKTLQAHNETLKINVLTPRSPECQQVNGPYDIRGGVDVRGAPIPFEFNPKGAKFNVTDVWIFIVIGGSAPDSSGTLSSILLNEGQITVGVSYGPTPKAISISIQDLAIHKLLVSGINTVTLDYDGYGLVYEIDVLISYEYLA